MSLSTSSYLPFTRNGGWNRAGATRSTTYESDADRLQRAFLSDPRNASVAAQFPPGQVVPGTLAQYEEILAARQKQVQ